MCSYFFTSVKCVGAGSLPDLIRLIRDMQKKSPSSPRKEDGDSNSRGTTSYYQSETDLSAISLCKQLICSSLTVGIRSGLLGSMGEWPVHPDSLQGMFFFCMAASHHPAALWTYSLQSWKRMCPAHCLFFKPNYNSFEKFHNRKNK